MSLLSSNSCAEIPFPLLRLPGELRNKIYEHVLTSSAPLHHRQTLAVVSSLNNIETLTRYHSFEEDTASSEPFFNSLKFTCKQLYAETADMELKFNAIAFTPQCDESPNTERDNSLPDAPRILFYRKKGAEQWFFNFASSLMDQKVEWLSTVIIHSTSVLLVAPLVTFAIDHPRIDVRYKFKDFRLAMENFCPYLPFLSMGCVLTTILRGREEAVLVWKAISRRLFPIQRLDELVTVCREDWDMYTDLRHVPNLSIWPVNEFDEVEAALEQKLKISDLGEAEFQACVKYAKMWAENGIPG